MKERIVDLNSRSGCTTAVITLGDKTFRISRVVIAARVKYANYLMEFSHLLDDASRIKDGDQKAMEALNSKYQEFGELVPDILKSIIRLLLEKNGYEFSEEWWDENADIEDMRNFIDASLSKDTATVKKKK